MTFDPLGEDDAIVASAPWQPTPWWAWAAGLQIAGLAVVVWAGARLAGSDLGTSLRTRGCDSEVLLAVSMLGVGALLLLLGVSFARLHHPGALLSWDASTLPFTLPVPLLLLGAALPGIAGCRLARDIADLAFVGDALVGASGIVVAGAAVALLAASLAATASVSWLAPRAAQQEDPPGLVELAIAEAEALEADGSAQRFHGVEPLD